MKNNMLIALSVLLSFLFVLNISNAIESNIDSQDIALIDKISALL